MLATILALVAPALAPAQGITLDFPSWQAEEPGFAEWWKGLISDYEAKHPGVKVKLDRFRPALSTSSSPLARIHPISASSVVNFPTSEPHGEPIDDLLSPTRVQWSKMQTEMAERRPRLLAVRQSAYYNEKLPRTQA
jgi:multiple sugar transport system substrate-binding protein